VGLVLACTSLVFCALCVRVKKIENKITRNVGLRLGLSDKRETFGCYNSLLMSDLVNHTAIWSNYMRIDIDLFEELFNLVETRISKKSTKFRCVWVQLCGFAHLIFYLLGKFVMHRIQGVSKIMPTLSTKYTEQSPVLSTTLHFHS